MILVLTALATAAPAPTIAIIPRPVELTRESGVFRLGSDSVVEAGKGCAEEAVMLRRFLCPGTGLRLAPGKSSKSEISLSIDPNQGHGEEGYTMKITPTKIQIIGGGSAGVFYGIETLRQLLPADTFRPVPMDPGPYEIPCLKIVDYPRFAWRGAHLDCGRHFMPLSFVLKYIDLLAMHKLNTFHWHLTEDQGWRLQIKEYPKLTQHGAWRAKSMISYSPATYDPRFHGGFYTQEDAKEVVAYAKQRHVTVVPEIEMPGHSTAAVSSYPELGNTGKQVPVDVNWGVSDDTLNMKDSTVKIMENVLTEVMAIFPSKFIHVGGDEAPTTQWANSPDAKAKMKELGITDPRGLQTWFTHQIDSFLTAHGRRLVGWDEILEGGKLAPGATVMSWRGEQGGITAASEGHDVVMAPGSYTYLDKYQSRDHELEPLAIGGLITIKGVYDYDPIPASMPAADAKHVLGAQVQLWTEYIPDAKHLEYMAFPRMCAFSEVVWSPKEGKNYDGFMDRLKVHLGRLDALDVNYRRLDPPTPVIGKWQTSGDGGTSFEMKYTIPAKDLEGRQTIRLGIWNTGGDQGVTVQSLSVDSQPAELDNTHVDSRDDDANVISFQKPADQGDRPLTVLLRFSLTKKGSSSGNVVLLPDPENYHPYTQGSR